MVFLSRFPFYYELKIIVVLWLLSPATQGSSILYRKFVHPILVKREQVRYWQSQQSQLAQRRASIRFIGEIHGLNSAQEIDDYLARAKEQGYRTVVEYGARGVQYATQVIMQTAIRGGGGLVNQLRRSYSVGDVNNGDQRDHQSVRRTAIIRQVDENDARYDVQRLARPTPSSASLQEVSDSEMENYDDPFPGTHFHDIFHVKFHLDFDSLWPAFSFIGEFNSHFARQSGADGVADETSGAPGSARRTRHQRRAFH